MSQSRVYRAGDEIDDLCRACKIDRSHTVIVADQAGRPLRVQCGFCQSQHNYRGGTTLTPNSQRPNSQPLPTTNSQPFPTANSQQRPTANSQPRPTVNSQPRPTANSQPRPTVNSQPTTNDFPLVSDRERTAPPMTLQDRSEDLELLLRRIIREEAGLSPVAPAQKWRGGTFVLRPGTPGLQEKSWPIETFFHKVVMLRNRLRTLEQQINASDLPEDVKLKLQGYVSGCYGSLTSFNVLFADERDQFKGSSGE